MVFKGILIDTFDGLANQLDYPNPFPLHDILTDHGKAYAAMIGVKQEEFIHLNGNENDLVEFEDCLPWQDVTNGINCSKICMPVIFHALFGQEDNRPKCHVPSEHNCMVMTSADKLVRFFFKALFLNLQHVFFPVRAQKYDQMLEKEKFHHLQVRCKSRQVFKK